MNKLFWTPEFKDLNLIHHYIKDTKISILSISTCILKCIVIEIFRKQKQKNLLNFLENGSSEIKKNPNKKCLKSYLTYDEMTINNNY